MVRGDRGAADEFDAVFRELRPGAFRVAFRVLGDRAEADDVAAEALARALVAWRRVGSLPYRDAWVMRVAANVAVDVARRRRPIPTPPIPTDDPEETAAVRIALAAALAALSRRQREVVSLRYLGGLSVAEVAECLAISQNSVKTHAQHGLSMLRRQLGPSWQEAGVD